MKPTKKSSTRKQAQLFRSLLATAFVANGFFPFVAPAFAEGTAAGQSISNTATATYEDPNLPGTTINATSNTVTVTVAEVAGITVVNTGVPVDSTPANAITVGDDLTYTFTVTNVGNDPTKFRIPNLATTTGPVAVNGNLEYNLDDGKGWIAITGSEYISASQAVGASIQVRVKVTVQPGAQLNDSITVQLGDTPGNAQNVARVDNGGDVFTVDNADSSVTGEITGVPINGTREASAKQSSVVGGVTKNMALATLLKTRTAYDNNATPATIGDDKLTYGLSLRVESNDITGLGLTPQALAGYAGLFIDSSTPSPNNYILVSDVIPTGTVLAVPPTAPSGWEAVYSTTDITSKPNAVLWTKFATTTPTLLNVKRVGFIKQTTVAADNIPVGTTVTGFSIQVAVDTSGSTPTTLSINNIAQLVGQTPGTDGKSVYDESGDINPSNYNGTVGSMTPGTTDGNADGIPDNSVTDNTFNGVADPAAQGVDSGNNNTGTGTGGEDNVLVISAATAVSILNGPLNAPAAIGPDGTTATDFTNKSSFIAANTSPGSVIDPQAVAFSNTLTNNGTASGTVTLVPTKPAVAGDLPTNTTVTVSYQGQSATYTYDGNAFTLNTGNTAISIPSVAAGATIGYGVEVNLPADTKLSTDTGKGYPVPVTATITDPADANNNASNITIDRVYTGFLQLIKVSRILQGTGPAVGAGQDIFESTPAYVNPGPDKDITTAGDNVTIDYFTANPDVARKPAPGNIIEYQIRYKNISTPQAGVGNVILSASQVKITEDGTAGTNNWAVDNDGNSIIDTSNVTNPQASDSNSGTITFFPSVNQTGTTQATDVTKYVNSVTTIITPNGNGTFTFQRKVN